MKEHQQRVAPARGPIAAAVFGIIFVLLLPVFLVGCVVWVVALFTGRKSGMSQAAQAPLAARWFQHSLGTRRDEPADRLITVISGVPPLALRLVAGPLMVAYRLSGYVPKSFRYPYEGEITLGTESRARQTFFDGVLERHLADVTQFVILGAGFDTRALNLPKDTPVRSFEMDTPATQAVKRDMLARAGIDATAVTFASADFESEDWLTRLVEAGFDLGKPALFILEGVIPYLDREAVETTLRKIAGTAKGSIVAFDYLTSEVLESNALSMRAVRASLSAGGEPLKFGIDSMPPSRERLAELLRSCGLTLFEQRTLGAEQETAGRRAWGGFAVAVVK